MPADFVTVAKTGDVAIGELAAFDVSGTKVAIANVGGALYAIDDVCTHRQCSLADGDLEDTTVTCPCHGSQFDVQTGGVLTPPATVPVKSYPVRMEGDAIQIEI